MGIRLAHVGFWMVKHPNDQLEYFLFLIKGLREGKTLKWKVCNI